MGSKHSIVLVTYGNKEILNLETKRPTFVDKYINLASHVSFNSTVHHKHKCLQGSSIEVVI